MTNWSTEDYSLLSWKTQFNGSVDFCIWVLEIDGMYIPPFDQHVLKRGALQEAGLTSESWYLWLKRVVALQDSWLRWREETENEQSWVNQQIVDYEIRAALMNKDINIPRILEELHRQWQQNEYQRQQAIERLGHINQISDYPWCANPPDLWDGESIIKELLQILWQQYIPLWEERGRLVNAHEETAEISETQMSTLNQLDEDLQCFKGKLVELDIYFVDYSAVAECLVPPKSVILSIRNGLPGEIGFNQSLLQAVENLQNILNQSSNE